MKRSSFKLAGVAALLLLAAATLTAQTPTLHSKWVGNILRYYVGTTSILDIDGTNAAVDVKSVGKLKIAGTAVTSTAAELNYTDVTTAGTAQASKALVTDANSAINILRTASLRIGTSGSETTIVPTGAAINLLTQGVAAGYKIARGVATTGSASDTVVSGLTTVVAVICTSQDDVSTALLFVTCSIGDQAGTPAAGSFLLKTWKPTAVNDVTPTAATSFSKLINWIAIGT